MPSPLGLDASEVLLKVRMAEKQNSSTVGYLCDGNGGDSSRRIVSRYLDC